MFQVSNDRSSVSHGINAKHMTAISYTLNVAGITVSIHKTTDGIKILIKPVSEAE